MTAWRCVRKEGYACSAAYPHAQCAVANDAVPPVAASRPPVRLPTVIFPAEFFHIVRQIVSEQAGGFSVAAADPDVICYIAFEAGGGQLAYGVAWSTREAFEAGTDPDLLDRLLMDNAVRSLAVQRERHP